jgi:hypothetical protein
LAGTLLGTSAYCTYSRLCHVAPDDLYLLYDVIAGLVAYSFPAQLLAEAVSRQISPWWCLRLVGLLAMSVATVGREFFGWPLSGHVLTVAGVTVIQVTDGRLPRWLRQSYVVSATVVVAFRALVLDRGISAPLWLGMAVGLVIGAGTVVTRVIGNRRWSWQRA